MRRKGSKYAAIVCACAMVFSSVPVYASDDIPVDAQNEEVQEQNVNEEQEVEEDYTGTNQAEQSESQVQNSENLPSADTTNSAQIVGMSIEGVEDKENIETPVEFKAKIKLKNLWQQGVGYVSYVGLSYWCNGQQSYYFYNNETQYRDYANEDATLEVPISLNEYYCEGEYQLVNFQITEVYSEDDVRTITYQYNVATDSYIDDAGNQYAYSKEADFCVTKSEKSGQIYGQLNNLTISNQEDKDQIKAPADIMMTMDAKNVKEDDPFTVEMIYDRDGETCTFSNTYGTTASEEKAIYKDGKIQFPIKIGKYDKFGTYKLKQIVVTDSKTKVEIRYHYEGEKKQFIASDIGNMYSFAYNGEADFTVNAPEEGDGVPIEIMDLSVDGDKDHITQQSDVKIRVKLKNYLKQSVKSVVVLYKNTEDERETTLSKYYYSPEWFPGEEGDVCEIPVSFELQKFSTAGQYKLESIKVKLNDYPDENVCYTNENGTLVGEYSVTGAKVKSVYNGELDLNVTEAPEQDTEAPYVNSIKFSDEEGTKELYQAKYDKMNLEVGYTENLTGVSDCAVTWQSTDKERYAEAMATFKTGEIKAGTGTFALSTSLEFIEPGTYHVCKIEIYDKEGLLRTYEQGSEEGILTDDKGNSVAVDNISFTVKQAQDNGLKVKEMRWEDGVDTTQLQVGDQVKGYMTVQNTSQKDITVDPASCYIFWNTLMGNTDSYAKCEGEKFVLKSGCDRELPFLLTIEKDTSVSGERRLKEIVLNNKDKKVSTKYLVGHTGYLYSRTIEPSGIPVETNLTMKEFNYSVTGNISEEIQEEPIVESVSVENESVNAGEDIKLKIKVADTQKLPITSMTMNWKNKETQLECWNNTISPEADYTYSEKEHCYYVNIPTNSSWDEGEYYLYNLTMNNKAGGFGNYVVDDKGMMYKYQTSNIDYFQTVTINLTKDDVSEPDYTAPVLESAEIVGSNNVTSAGEVTYRIKASDVNKVSGIRLGYSYNKGKNTMTLKSSSIKEESEDTYLCTFQISRYRETGDYQLQTIGLIDGSVNKNDRVYKYNEKTGEFESEDMTSVKVSGNLAITMKEDKVIVSGEKNLEDEVEKAEEGTILVIADLQKELVISPDTMKEIKEKDLSVIITNEDRTATISFNGEDLEKIPDKDLKLTIERGGMLEAKIPNGMGTQEMLYYPIKITTTDASLLVGISVKLDDEFLKQVPKKTLCLSRKNADGTIEVMQNFMYATADGYFSYAFFDGVAPEQQKEEQSLPTELDELHSAVTLASDLNPTVEEYEFIISAPKKEKADVVLGDINQDGSINIQDLMLCLNHVSQKSLLTGDGLAAADVDESGAVDIRDLMRLLNYVSGKSATL